MHEHQRPDRDDYIDIDMAAVNTTGRFNQFKKAGFPEIENEALNLKFFDLCQNLLKINGKSFYLGEYDTKSIMHYDGLLRGVFQHPIMKDKLTGKGIGVNKNMSPLDIEKLNKMYPCKGTDPVCGKFS